MKEKDIKGGKKDKIMKLSGYLLLLSYYQYLRYITKDKEIKRLTGRRGR